MARRGAGNLNGPSWGFPPDNVHFDGCSRMKVVLLRFPVWFEEVKLGRGNRPRDVRKNEDEDESSFHLCFLL